MITKTVFVGHEAFTYSSLYLQKAAKYGVSINNQNLNRLNFYFFNISEDWLMENEDPFSPFVITFYKLSENSEVLDIETARIIIDDNNNHERHITCRDTTERPRILNIKHLDIEVNQHVPEPNTLTLQFVLKNCPSSSHTYYYILLLTETATGRQYLELIRPIASIISSCVYLKSRNRYEYQLYEVHQQTKQLTVVGETGLISIVTHNKQADVKNLQTLAEIHLKRIGSSQATVHHLYRNKPTDHPTILKAEKTGIMEKYLKDNNGDPALSINNKINGLFFLANAKTTSGEIPEDSSFGNYRIMIPPQYLVDGGHLYFADFTCCNGKSHYITLVLTKTDSVEDKYCHNRLVKLDFSDNPFFYKDCDVFFVCHGPHIKVEILYTENVNLCELKSMKLNGLLDFREYTLADHQVTWEGHSTPGGIPKPSHCTYCNLSPIQGC